MPKPLRFQMRPVAVLLGFSALAAAQVPARPQTPQPPFPYVVREVSIKTPDGTRLTGTFTIPKDSTRSPAVVLAPGAGAVDRDDTIMGHKPFQVVADHLARRGIASLRLDSRGIGGSTGSYMQAGGEELAADLRAAVSFLHGQPEVNPQTLGLVGHSQGGIVCALAAAGSPEVRFLVLLAAPGLTDTGLFERRIAEAAQRKGIQAVDVERLRKAFREARARMFNGETDEQVKNTFAEVVRLVAPAGVSLPPAVLAAAVDQQIAAAQTPNARFFLPLDPRTVYKRVRCPVLALNGSRDQNVPSKENLSGIEEALRDGGNRNLKTMELDGLNHFFQTAKTGSSAEVAAIEETFAPAALDVISRWILALR